LRDPGDRQVTGGERVSDTAKDALMQMHHLPVTNLPHQVQGSSDTSPTPYQGEAERIAAQDLQEHQDDGKRQDL
jgi:hypothetical protein